MVVRRLLVTVSVLAVTLTAGCSSKTSGSASSVDGGVEGSGQAVSTQEIKNLVPTCDTIKTVAAEQLQVSDLEFDSQNADGIEGGAGSGCGVGSSTIDGDIRRGFELSASAMLHGRGAAGMAEFVETMYTPLEGEPVQDEKVDVEGADQAYLSPAITDKIQLNVFKGNVYVIVLSADAALSPDQNLDRASKVATAVLSANTFE